VIRSLAPAVLVVAMITSTAAADPSQTYAYVSHVRVKADFTGVRSTGGNNFTHFYCTFTIQVPRTSLNQAPTGASTELLADATIAYDKRDYTISGNGHATDCTKYDHTWQLVTLDPGDAHSVSLAVPPPPVDWPQRILWLFVGLIVLSYAVEKVTGKSVSIFHYVVSFSIWRSRRRMARIDRRLAKAREARMPRAQVVETKNDAPSGE